MAGAKSPVIVEMYTRPGCHLCEVAQAIIEKVRRQTPFEWRVVDISGDADLEAQFGEQIPVVFVDGRKAFKFHVDEAGFRRKIEGRTDERG